MWLRIFDEEISIGSVLCLPSNKNPRAMSTMMNKTELDQVKVALLLGEIKGFLNQLIARDIFNYRGRTHNQIAELNRRIDDCLK